MPFCSSTPPPPPICCRFLPPFPITSSSDEGGAQSFLPDDPTQLDSGVPLLPWSLALGILICDFSLFTSLSLPQNILISLPLVVLCPKAVAKVSRTARLATLWSPWALWSWDLAPTQFQQEPQGGRVPFNTKPRRTL